MAEIALPESWAGVAEPLRALLAEIEREATPQRRRILLLCRRSGCG